MKLRNKKTGEIADLSEGFIRDTYNGEMIQIKPVAISNKEGYVYGSLAELNEEWEDYKEPKQDALSVMILTLTNYIENEPSDNVDLDDCKNMLEKLKAWERLKDKGMIKYSFHKGKMGIDLDFYTLTILAPRDKDSLNLLFGGEE